MKTVVSLSTVETLECHEGETMAMLLWLLIILICLQTQEKGEKLCPNWQLQTSHLVWPTVQHPKYSIFNINRKEANQTTVFSNNRTHNEPFPALLFFFSLSRLLRAETSACSFSTRRSLSSTSLHAFCPTQNTQAESQCVWSSKQVQTHFLLLLTCSSDCSDSFILFTSLTSLSCPLDEKNLALER